MKKIVFISMLALGCSHMEAPLEKEVLLVNPGKGQKRQDHEAQSKKFMITTQGVYATKAAEKMFELGGNIADAAAAASFVISVERPQSTGIGGGGFLLYFDAVKNKDSNPWAYDFREKAPLLAHNKMFLNQKGEEIKGKSLDGIFAAGVPGLVAGIVDFQKEHGKLDLSKVIAPAIELAQNGFIIYPELAKALKYREDVLCRFKASRKIFCHKNRKALKEGERLVQKDLAKTLKIISKKGRDGFYKGYIANQIIKENRRLGGLMQQNDLDQYDVKLRRPVMGSYKDYEIYSMSPPSSGGAHVVQILNILENDDLKYYGVHHPKTIHLTATAMQLAFVDRAKYMGDSDFVSVPLTGLTSKKYAKDLRFSIPESKALNKMWAGNLNPFLYQSLKVKNEHKETTHFTIMDDQGNVVSSTQTINGYFGSGVVVPGTGILLNNEMDDFATKPGAKNLFGAVGSDKNLVEPQKRPLSSMSPTIVFKDKKPILALGTPSGTRILTCVAQTILNYIEHDLSLYDSVHALRYHHQWMPDEIRFEEVSLPKRTSDKLKRMEHQLNFKNFGCRIQAVAKEGEFLKGVSDARGRGFARGL
ncbi:gamma-glutamyltransferase [Halobacteriovorax sp. GB3]|uniref:gamma-glutamyltransferase n=1 Tax=Halobacteriovorax sp. GB3 TaxID=2719615 RepID=UPI0023609ED8|nr:gamma-glutamyltransferase [Halobacteriovorax sp. GB3]MDD0851969.1 gamma-glutamyltransferase [Halobacteriovorax sp. GB3]